MEENKKSKLGLGILIGVLVTLVICMGAFIIYDKVLSDDNEKHDNVQVEDKNNNEENDNKDSDIDNNQDSEVLDYEIITVSENEEKLVVNGKDTGLVGFNISNVEKMEDVLLATIDSNQLSGVLTIYVIDKDAKVINSFIGNSYVSNDNYPKVSLKGGIIRHGYTIDGNDIYIDSDNLSQDDVAIVCEYSQDADVVEYTEKVTYLGNGNFSSSIITSTTTSLEYKNINNIKCN